MKKTYINPNIEVVKISTAALLSGSETQQLKTGTASEWGAREMDFFDEE